MIEKLYITLLTIYKNRIRELTFKDASAFYIPLIVYFLSIYKIYEGTFPSFPQFDFTSYILIAFSFTFCIHINNRKDIDLLKLLFGNKWSYVVIFLDLLLVNLIQLFICIKTNQHIALYTTLASIIFFTFYKNKVNTPLFKSFIHPLSALLKTQLRMYKSIYILIVICYYLAYQGLIESNQNLFIVSLIGLIYILFLTISNPEKLEYFVLSKLNNKIYILKGEFVFLIDYSKFVLPIFVISLFIQPLYSLYIVYSIGLIPCLYPLKYINYNHKIILGFTSFFVSIFLIKILIDYSNNYWLILSPIPLSYILHRIAFRKFTKEQIQNDTEFYL